MSKPIERYEVILSNGFVCTVLAPDAQTAKRIANKTLGHYPDLWAEAVASAAVDIIASREGTK
jgi:hypothetical protein